MQTAWSAGLVSAVLAVAGRHTVAAAKAPAAVESEPAAVSGFRETEHVRKYYAAARYF